MLAANWRPSASAASRSAPLSLPVASSPPSRRSATATSTTPTRSTAPRATMPSATKAAASASSPTPAPAVEQRPPGPLGLERIAIVDWDVHHGNGTEHAFFYEDPGVLTDFLSPGRPLPGRIGAGRAHRQAGAGEGFNNQRAPTSRLRATAPTRRRSSGSSSPRWRSFRPQIVVIASGLDASDDGPAQAMMMVTSEGDRHMTDANGRPRPPASATASWSRSHEGGYSSPPTCRSAAPP